MTKAKKEWHNPRFPPYEGEIRQLYEHLGRLVSVYHRDVANRPTTIRDYEQTMLQMYALGWDDILDWESTLPFEDMPKEYQERVGPPGPFDANAWKMPAPPRSCWQRLWERLVGPPKG